MGKFYAVIRALHPYGYGSSIHVLLESIRLHYFPPSLTRAENMRRIASKFGQVKQCIKGWEDFYGSTARAPVQWLWSDHVFGLLIIYYKNHVLRHIKEKVRENEHKEKILKRSYEYNEIKYTNSYKAHA